MARGWKFQVKLVDGLYYLYSIARSKALINCVVTAQLIFAFVLPYAKIRVSQEATHINISFESFSWVILKKRV